MALINLQTDLKSLKFGHDRIGGGSSNQPYIKSPIPDKIGEYGFLNTDFILRGGSKAVTNSLTDVARLGKYFTDVRNPSGLLFVAKQNLLSRMAVRTQASGKLLNEGVYTPLSTLIEAGGVAFGLHVNKQGLNPFGGVGGINTYSEAIELSKSEVGWEINDRLTVLYNFKIVNEDPVYNLKGIKVDSGGVNVLSYSGGPGSILGIGKTNIKFAGSSASERTGENNPNLKNSGFFTSMQSTSYGTLNQNYSVFKKPLPTNINGTYLLGVSIAQGINLSKNGFNINGQVVGEFRQIGQLNTVDKNVSGSIDLQYNSVYTQQQLNDIPQSKPTGGNSWYIGKNGITTPGDFRDLLRKNLSSIQKIRQKEIGNLINSPDYAGDEGKNIEKRLSLGDPGNRSEKNLTSYTTGSGGSYFGAASPESYDKITTKEIYFSNKPKFSQTTDTNDLVKFAITVVNNDDQSFNTNIHFRAFLNTISDQYSADWNPTKYLGRGENFYTYGGFDRKVSLSWTVAAQSKKELIPMYKKLNYLASVCAPDYSGQGYMRGNLVKLTVGGYFYEQYGIITGLSYEMNDDSATWEIGINDKGGYDETVKELPHLIKVSSFNFIPIHDFVPRKVQEGTENFGTKERFIALKATDSNYDR